MNSPFFTKQINYLDTVEARPTDNPLVFEFRQVVERGGHSTYMLLMQDNQAGVSSCWDMLEKTGCSYESMHLDLGIGRRVLFSVDVPPSTDLCDVYEILERGEHDGVWIFQEGYAHLIESTKPF